MDGGGSMFYICRSSMHEFRTRWKASSRTLGRRRTETSRRARSFLTVPFFSLLFWAPLTLTLTLVVDLALVSPPDRRMGMVSDDAIMQLAALMDQLDEPLKITFQNVHQGYPNETLVRFLKAREGNVGKAHKMLVDSLNWRIQNGIDNILSKPIIPMDLYRAIRDSQLIGLSGYSKEGHPVFAIGVGLSTFDKASKLLNSKLETAKIKVIRPNRNQNKVIGHSFDVHYYVQSHIQLNEYRDRVVLPAATKKYGRHIGTCLKVLDMTGLKLSALSQIKLLTIISTVDDLNYPEKTETYYIVNAPCIFSACWKVVKPLLQERTRRKVRVLKGCGRDELLKIMDYASLPHFCRSEGSGSSRRSSAEADDCFSFDHPFHQQLYGYINQQALRQEFIVPFKQGSFHVDVPEPDSEGTKIVKTIESELHRISDQNGLARSISDLKIESA